MLIADLEGEAMVLMAVTCPSYPSDNLAKRDKTDTGKQRYRCQNPDCPHHSFLLDPAYKGRLPEIKTQIIDMALNGSGIRDTARVLGISTDTVISELKKASTLISVNQPLLETLLPSDVEVVIPRENEAEMDEMWSYVQRKKEPRWLWHAIDPIYAHLWETDKCRILSVAYNYHCLTFLWKRLFEFPILFPKS
jgi:transposase-like protein